MPSGLGTNSTIDYSAKNAHSTSSYIPHLYEDLPPTNDPESQKHGPSAHGPDELTSFNSKFGLLLPNPAPDVAPADESTASAGGNTSANSHSGQHIDGKKLNIQKYNTYYNTFLLFQI